MSSSDDFVTDINICAKNNKLFWVCAIAKDCNSILMSRLNELHPVARMATEHYCEEEK